MELGQSERREKGPSGGLEIEALTCGSCCERGVATGDGIGDLTWMRVGIALALAGQGMVFGLGYNNALRAGEAPAFGSLPYVILHGALLVSALAVMGLLGRPLLRSMIQAVRMRKMTVEGLFFLSALGALVGSLISTITGRGSVYYEIVAIVLVIYTVGRKVGVRTQERAMEAVRGVREDHTLARIRGKDGVERWVSVGALVAGESLVVVRPGESIPTDGIVVAGVSDVMESTISGETTPARRTEGDRVYGGTHVVDGGLEIRATAVGGKRVMDQILGLVEAAMARPSRIQVEADRVMAWFLPIVVSLSVGTFGVWFYLVGVDWTEALFNAMAVLLVACPCAVGLATPIAIWATLLRLSRRGFVSRSGTLLEGLTEAEVFFFDKTGTLSEDRLKVTGLKVVDGRFDEALIKVGVASLEAQVNHPIARCLATISAERNRVDGLRIIAGSGVEGLVDGRKMRIGRGDWLGVEAKGGKGGDPVKRTIYVEIDGRIAAVIELDEIFRAEAEEAIRGLKADGYGVRILTGDPEPVRKTMGGVEIEAGLSPQEKAEKVRAEVAKGRRVVFIGDGMNDAGAMAEATISISMESGDSLTRTAADVVLMGGNLGLIRWAQGICRTSRDALRGNLRFAVCYNGVGMGLAAMGWLHPVVAALLMLLSSLWVSFRAARLAEVKVSRGALR